MNAECPARDKAPLDVLTNHLLFGLGAKKETGRRSLTLDEREALHIFQAALALCASLRRAQPVRRNL